METISNTLFWISNGLLVPVVVLLLLFFLRAIILAGGFFGEFYQRMKLQKQFTETLENITPENIERTAAATPIGRQLPSPPQLVQIVRTPGRRCLLRTPACQL